MSSIYCNRTIGEGAFGKVYEVTYKEKKYALKEVKGNLGRLHFREIELLSDLSHDRIIKYHCYGHIAWGTFWHEFVEGSKERPTGILLELCVKDLAKDLEGRSKIDEKWSKKIFSQIVEGIVYFHGKDVCHRDLKPQNILVTNAGNIKISDFGIAKGEVGTASGAHTVARTPGYAAPEVDSGHYGKKVDIYSLGVILVELYTLEDKVRRWIMQADKRSLPTGHKVPSDFLTLSANMLDHNSNNRPAAKTIWNDYLQ